MCLHASEQRIATSLRAWQHLNVLLMVTIRLTTVAALRTEGRSSTYDFCDDVPNQGAKG